MQSDIERSYMVWVRNRRGTVRPFPIKAPNIEVAAERLSEYGWTIQRSLPMWRIRLRNFTILAGCTLVSLGVIASFMGWM